MINYLKHNEIDKVKWDACIKESFNSMVYAASWYLDLVHEEWDALVEGDYERVMPLTGRKKYSVYYLFQPFFTQQLGVFSKSILTPSIIKEFIDHIPAHFQYIDINLNSFNRFEDKNLILQSNKNFVLDLINEYPKLAAKYSVNTKRNLKKSAASKLSCIKSIKPEVIITLFRENRGKMITKWKDRHYIQLQKLIYTSIHKGRGNTYGIFDENNQLCAGAFFVSSNNRLIFLFSGSNDIAKEKAAMTMLIDEVIKEFAPGNMVLDFEGSNDPNLARFYRGFGAKESSYLSLRINKLKFPLNWALRFYQTLKMLK